MFPSLGGGFQRVLVDECTQACEPSVLVPLGRQCEQARKQGECFGNSFEQGDGTKSFGLSMFVTFSLIFTYNLYMYLYNLYTFHPSCLLLMPILVS